MAIQMREAGVEGELQQMDVSQLKQKKKVKNRVRVKTNPTRATFEQHTLEGRFVPNCPQGGKQEGQCRTGRGNPGQSTT
jgi:hypothetical protein